MSFHTLRENRFLCFLIVPIIALFVSSFFFPATAYTQNNSLDLPAPGAMLRPSSNYVPPLLKAITIDPDNALKFDFIIDTGDTVLQDDALRTEADKLVKYFMAALTVPAEELWVNLSPYEKDRIIPRNFGYTEMGRDLLMQDYVLKQLTASMMYPEDDLGQAFWQRIKQKAQEIYGTTDIPMNTFNKIWIVPDDAIVLEQGNNAIVVNSRLKVMLEEDYLALKENLDNEGFKTENVIEEEDARQINTVMHEVIYDLLIPEIEKEVNEGENFANLRQIYNAMILATWYKQNLKESFLSQAYVDRNKIVGVDVSDPFVKEKIFDQYVQAFETGVYNYSEQEFDLETMTLVPKQYYSGGADMAMIGSTVERGRVTIPEAGLNQLLEEMRVRQPETAEIIEAGLRPPISGDRRVRVGVALLEQPDRIASPNSSDYLAFAATQNPASFRERLEEVISPLNIKLSPQQIQGVVAVVQESRSITDIVDTLQQIQPISNTTTEALRSNLRQLEENTRDRWTPYQPASMNFAAAVRENRDNPEAIRAVYRSAVEKRLTNELGEPTARLLARTIAELGTSRMLSSADVAVNPPRRYEAEITEALEGQGIAPATARRAATIASDPVLMREVITQLHPDQFHRELSAVSSFLATTSPAVRENVVQTSLERQGFTAETSRELVPFFDRSYVSLQQLEDEVVSRTGNRDLARQVAQPEVVDQIISSVRQQEPAFSRAGITEAAAAWSATRSSDSQRAVINVTEALKGTPLAGQTPQVQQAVAQAWVNLSRQDIKVSDNEQMRSALTDELRQLGVDGPQAEEVISILTGGESPAIYRAITEATVPRDTYDPRVARIAFKAEATSGSEALRQGFQADLTVAAGRIAQRPASGVEMTREQIRQLTSEVQKARSIADMETALRSAGVAAPERVAPVLIAEVERVSQERAQAEALLPVMHNKIAREPEVFVEMANRVFSQNLGIEIADELAPVSELLPQLPATAFDNGLPGVLSALERADIPRSSRRQIEQFFPELARLTVMDDMGRRHSLSRGPGGIDFNTAMLDLVVQKEGEGVQMVVAPATLDTLNIGGFEPVITRVDPVDDFMRELGL